VFATRSGAAIFGCLLEEAESDGILETEHDTALQREIPKLILRQCRYDEGLPGSLKAGESDQSMKAANRNRLLHHAVAVAALSSL
jgi:hypothetical protein